MRVRCYSHLRQPSGFGEAARRLATALGGAVDQLELRSMGGDMPLGWLDQFTEPTTPDVIIVHTLPADCHRVLEIEGLKIGRGPKLACYTTWEALTAPPELLQRLVENFDQVWVPSQVTAAAFRNALRYTSAHNEPGIIQVVPHCFDEEAVREEWTPPVTGFRFYWMGAWSARKNPGGLIRAFALAFRPSDNVELVLHSPGCSMDTFVGALAATGLRQDQLPSITLSNKHLDDNGVARLHASSDCFVTAARGEAWNLPAFDAMLAGRHVISQYGLGSDEYLVDTSADLTDGLEAPAQVDVSFVAADDGAIRVKTTGAQGLTSRELWLEPNLSSLAEAMKSARKSLRRDIEINYDPVKRFGYAAVAAHVLDLMEKL